MADWERIRREYISGKGSQADLSLRYGVSRSAIAMRASREHWSRLREEAMKTGTELWDLSRREALIRQGEGSQEGEAYRQEKMAQMDLVSSKLLARVSQAIDELDITVIREVRKEKSYAYDHPNREDKTTGEEVVEREILTTVKTTVDRNGIKLLAAALKDIRDVQMLRDPSDLREQEAKIAKLEREAQQETESGALTVTFAGDAEGCSE